MGEVFAKVGDDISGNHPTVFELIIEEHVSFVNPLDYGLESEQSINPIEYFITSGDAVEKAKVLENDMWSLAGELQKKLHSLLCNEHNTSMAQSQTMLKNGVRPTSVPGLYEYTTEVWKAAGQARMLHNALKKAKGPNCFLETEWEDHKLLCIPKNPRTKEQ